GFAATNAIVADLVPETERESAYAAMRVATNLGFVTGPPLGGLLLIGTHWPRFFAAVALVGLASAAVALTSLPRGRPAMEAAGEATTPAAGGFRAIVGDRAFLLLLASTLLGFVVYVAYEAVLPIAAVSSFGLAPATWGLLVIINPVLVTVLQMRLTRGAERFPAAPRLALSMLLMGLPFLLLLVNTGIVVIALVILIFVFGEMLWTPLAQALAARLSPAAYRGAYMGAFGASSSVAWAIAPLAALYLRQSHGDTPTWLFFATAAIAGAAAGIGACRAAARRPPQTSTVPDTATTAPLAADETSLLEPANR
ncbi:MAG TPA: MFS transporter, partial [Gaiellaceae bacterium]